MPHSCGTAFVYHERTVVWVRLTVAVGVDRVSSHDPKSAEHEINAVESLVVEGTDFLKPEDA